MIIAELTIEIWECVQTRRQPPRTGVGIVEVVKRVAIELLVNVRVGGSNPPGPTILILSGCSIVVYVLTLQASYVGSLPNGPTIFLIFKSPNSLLFEYIYYIKI